MLSPASKPTHGQLKAMFCSVQGTTCRQVQTRRWPMFLKKAMLLWVTRAVKMPVNHTSVCSHVLRANLHCERCDQVWMLRLGLITPWTTWAVRTMWTQGMMSGPFSECSFTIHKKARCAVGSRRNRAHAICFISGPSAASPELDGLHRKVEMLPT